MSPLLSWDLNVLKSNSKIKMKQFVSKNIYFFPILKRKKNKVDCYLYTKFIFTIIIIIQKLLTIS